VHILAFLKGVLGDCRALSMEHIRRLSKRIPNLKNFPKKPSSCDIICRDIGPFRFGGIRFRKWVTEAWDIYSLLPTSLRFLKE